MRDFLERIAAQQQHLTPSQALLLAKPSDLAYFLGFATLLPEEREAFLCLTKHAIFLIKAAFAPAATHPAYTILTGCKPPLLAEHMQQIVAQNHISTLFADFSALSTQEYIDLTHVLHPNNCVVTALDPTPIWQQRMQKDAHEEHALRQAAHIAQAAYTDTVACLTPGMSERAVADLLESKMKERGSTKPAFPTIVAFGPHGAEPHYQPQSTTLLQKETPVLIDFGATSLGYRSDLTRSFWFGDTPSAKFLQVEHVVMTAYTKAQAAAEQACVQTITAAAVDTAARQSIAAAGYADAFPHTTGHGIGLELHEPPSLNSQNTSPLLPRMSFTIEPGIYLEGLFGYRHENTFFLQSDRLEVL